MQVLNVTPKQITILILLFKFRFLTRHHLQVILNHKDPRRIKAWLKDLLEKEYIKRIYSEKVGENETPAIYYLDNKSRQVLKQQKGITVTSLNRIWREKKRSERFMQHNLFLADFYLYLLTFAKQQKQTLRFYTRTDMAGFNFLPLPLPDAYYSLEDEQKTVTRYFIEIFDDGTPKAVLKGRIEQYFDYETSQLWQKSTNYPLPILNLICPNETIKNSLREFTKEKLDDEASELTICLTHKGLLKRYGMKKETWQKVELN